jgi:hypothetical protein
VTPTLTIKKGATLQLIIQAKNSDGSAMDLSGVTVTSQIRDRSDNLIDTLDLATSEITGQLTAAQDTATYPEGVLLCDFKLVQNGVVLKSQTLQIKVEKRVTQ